MEETQGAVGGGPSSLSGRGEESSGQHEKRFLQDGDMDDVEAIKVVCANVAQVMRNFHENTHKLPPSGLKHVLELDAELFSLALKNPLNIKGDQPTKSENSRKLDESFEFGRTKKTQESDSLSTDDSFSSEVRKVRKQKYKSRKKVVVTSDSSPGTHGSSKMAGCRSKRKSKTNGIGQDSVDREEIVGPMDKMMQAFARFDTRSVPKPEPFNLASGQPFPDFLVLFEEYCQTTFKGSNTLWVSEFGRLLEGPIQEAFTALRVPGDSYKKIKNKLLKWCEESKENLVEQIRKKFEKTKMQPGESLRLFAARLESAFRLAYPHRDPIKSGTLRRKFLQTIPRSFRKQLSTAKSLMLMQGKDLAWQDILHLASRQDLDGESSDYQSAADLPSVWVSAAPVGEISTPRDKKYLTRSRLTPPARGGTFRDENVRSQRDDSRTCYHCHRTGHIKSECRELNNLCFACGSKDHRIARCPRRANMFSGMKPQRQPHVNGVAKQVQWESEAQIQRRGSPSPDPSQRSPLNW